MPSEQTRVWTVRELMKSAIDHLQRKGFEEARLNVELLLSHVLNLQRIQLYLSFDKPLTAEELKRFRQAYERRLKREPVQYIIGSANFMGLQFCVDPHVLIPRPETETLIEQLILLCQRYPGDQPIGLLDIGTGSGNIAVSAAKYIKQVHVTSIDISVEALNLARQNARAHGVDARVNFILADIFDSSLEIFHKPHDLVVSNPPYVSLDEWEQLQTEVREFEPSLAVTDGKDGFQFYREIASLLPAILHPGGSIALEVGYGQAEKVAQLLQTSGMQDLHIANDLQGIQRVVAGTRPGISRTAIHLN